MSWFNWLFRSEPQPDIVNEWCSDANKEVWYNDLGIESADECKEFVRQCLDQDNIYTCVKLLKIGKDREKRLKEQQELHRKTTRAQSPSLQISKKRKLHTVEPGGHVFVDESEEIPTHTLSDESDESTTQLESDLMRAYDSGVLYEPYYESQISARCGEHVLQMLFAEEDKVNVRAEWMNDALDQYYSSEIVPTHGEDLLIEHVMKFFNIFTNDGRMRYRIPYVTVIDSHAQKAHINTSQDSQMGIMDPQEWSYVGFTGNDWVSAGQWQIPHEADLGAPVAFIILTTTHWYLLKKWNGNWYNLDSLANPNYEHDLNNRSRRIPIDLTSVKGCLENARQFWAVFPRN